MIEDLDEALRKLLIREIPIKNGEVDIAFDQPRREWSTRISRPTLNLYIHDLHENNELRRSKQWQVAYNSDGTATQRRPPVRMDIHYMITAWAADPADEHRLLTRTLMVLLRHPTLPQDLLPERLQDQPTPIPLETAQPEMLVNAADIWSVMDNEMRPAIGCKATIAIDPYAPVEDPLVRTRELRIDQIPRALIRKAEESVAEAGLWTVSGTLHSEQTLEDVRLTLVERNLDVSVSPEGAFTVGELRAGQYTLEVAVEGGEPRRYDITVPSAHYDLDCDIDPASEE